MKLIVGLGNIGKAYENTRHNVGFIALDAILKDLGLKIDSNNFEGDYTVATINDQKVMFVKPTTLMNLSGNCVGQIARFYKIPPQDIIIIHDGIRPLVDETVLTDVIIKAQEHGNAVTSLPYNEQIFVVDRDDETVTKQFIPRETLRRVATPQAYRFDLLDEKYHEAFEKQIENEKLQQHNETQSI